MSIFASRTTKLIEMKDGGTVTVRKLAGRHIERARQEHSMAMMDSVKRMGVAFQRELAATIDTKDDEIKAVQSDPMNGFDLTTVLERGILAWSYAEKVTPELIDDMEDEARTEIATAIMKLTLPSLFLSAEEKAAEEKKD